MSTRKKLGIVTGYIAFVGATASSAIGAEADSALSTYDVESSSRIEITGAHTDNVLKSPIGVNDATLNLALISNLKLSKPDQVITADFGISSTQHRTHTKEEDDAYNLSANLLQKTSENWSFDIAAGIKDTVLSRGAITEEDADHRTKTKTYNASISGKYETERYQYSLALQHAQFDLQDNTKLGVTLNKDDEDRGETDIVLIGTYKLHEKFQPSFTFSYGKINYDQTLDDYGQNRSSDVIKFLLGGIYRAGPRASINGDIGYYWRNYSGVNFDPIKVAIGNVMINVQASENLIGFGGASRSFSELNILGSPGLIVENYSAGLTYKPTQKFSITGSTGKTHSEAQLLGVVAKDYVNSINGSYTFSERYTTLLQYTHTRRTTNNSLMISPYTENAIALKLIATF